MSQIQHIGGGLGAEMCFLIFVLVLHDAVLHCKWKRFRSEIEPNGTGSWGQEDTGGPGNCVELLVSF